MLIVEYTDKYKEQIKKLNETVEEKQENKIRINNKANQNRSSKNKRNWNYARSIRDNYFSDKSVTEIRSSLKNHLYYRSISLRDHA